MDPINKMVAEILGAFNGIIAILLLIGTVLAASNAGRFFFIVLIVGIILTIIACGIVAVLIDIKHEITKMSNKLDNK
tara:strand:- start:35 stop:265 length:231 start_codon:yes stop_codon:yes gene_type:complete